MKTELKKMQWFKSYSRIKIFTVIRAIFLSILTQNFNELEGPLRMLGFVSNFFCSPPEATEWDKIVADIIHTTFVFLEHPNIFCFLYQFYSCFICHK